MEYWICLHHHRRHLHCHNATKNSSCKYKTECCYCDGYNYQLSRSEERGTGSKDANTYRFGDDAKNSMSSRNTVDGYYDVEWNTR